MENKIEAVNRLEFIEYVRTIVNEAKIRHKDESQYVKDSMDVTYNVIASILAELKEFKTLDVLPITHAKWVLEESPYAELEEGVDGESHPRYVYSNCGQEAGFECDPDGFAGWQDRTPWCGNCAAKMDLEIRMDNGWFEERKEKHKPEDCWCYTVHSYDGQGGCLGTKEIDPCEGENCKRWRPKDQKARLVKATDMMPPELKPCPFCGGEAKINLFCGSYCATCTICMGGVSPFPRSTKEETAEEWNRRVTDAHS